MSRTQKQLSLLAVDMMLVPLALATAAAIIPSGAPAGLEWHADLVPVVLLVMLLTPFLATAFGIHNIRLKAYDLSGTGRTAGLAILLALISWGLARAGGLGLAGGVHVVFGLVFFLASAASRVAMLHLVLALYRREKPRSRVLIYGAGATGQQLAQALKTDQTIVPVAFVDDNPARQGLSISGLPVLKADRLDEIAAERGVRRVLLAMPSLSAPKRIRIARRLQSLGLEVQALPSFAQLAGETELAGQLAPVAHGALLGRARLDRLIETEEADFVGRSVLVSGAGGSIGSEICRQVLACKPARLVLYELSELALYTIEMELREPARAAGCTLVPVLGSVTDAVLARKVMGDSSVQVVLHAAAYKHVPLVEANPLAGLANNVLGTATLARAAQEAGVGRFILISSDKAVRPTNVMGASKRLAELVVQDLAERSRETVFAIVRFGNVLGSSGSVIPLFQSQIECGGPVTLTHAEVTRYFMTVEEAVRLVLRATSFAQGGEVFVLDMGAPVAIRNLARHVIEASGYTVRDAANPDGDIEIVITGLRPGEKLHEELLIGEGFLTTAHEKIFAAREASLSEIEVASALRSLREAVATADDAAARAVIARWVEGWGDSAEPAGLSLQQQEGG